MHAIEQFLGEAPLALAGLIIFAALVAALHLGIAVKRRTAADSSDKKDTDRDGGDAEGYIVSGALGLMALLLGFTFSLAIDRFDHRRSLTLEEANAIGTSYLRAQMLDEPSRSRLSALLKHYAATRLALANVDDSDRRAALMAESDAAQIRIWRATIDAVRHPANATASRPLIESMNTTIDMGAARVAARRAHVPPRVLVTLLFYMIISAFLLGFATEGSRWRAAPTLLLALFALAYLLTIDIDRPNGGGIREPQAPMEDLLAMIGEHPPGSFEPSGPTP